MSILDDDGGDDDDDDVDVEVSRSDAWGVARSDAPDVSRSDAYACGHAVWEKEIPVWEIQWDPDWLQTCSSNICKHLQTTK